MEISRIVEENINSCAFIYERIFAEAPWFEEFDYEMIRKYFFHCCNDVLYGGFIASENQDIIGFVTYFVKPSAAGDVLYIDELGVDLKYRRRGIATNLINTIKEFATANDIISILIHTDKESEAYNLYRNMGFKSDDSVVALFVNY